jgi:hypothetical protein
MKKSEHLKWHSQWLRCLAVISITLSGTLAAQSQGTINFDAHASFTGTNYSELGMLFQVIIPTRGNGSPTYDSMAGLPAILGPSNVPSNSTPYMIFLRQFSPDDYVSFSLTNGYTFGLTSVNLADPNSPSLAPVPISFVGLLANGFTVTNIFTTPGGGATSFLNYTFNSAFVSGLTSVEILSTRWAMDNLVFGNVAQVPEPGVGSLLLLGLLFWPQRKRGNHASGVKRAPLPQRN